jgi:hypothetical protein
VSYRPERVVGLLALTLAVAGSCAVFPDEATLPDHPGAAAAGGDENTLQAGHGGVVGIPPEAGNGGDSPAAGGTGGAGGTTLVVGGAGAGGEGAASAGGGTGINCVNPRAVVAPIAADTWIGSAKPSAAHASDPQLSVGAGSDEHRALMQVTLPAAPTDAVLSRATLVLTLESNADAGLSARRLALHRLDRPLDASRTTWTNYGNGGSRQWTTPGGDFGIQELGHANLPEGGQQAQATFNITSFVQGAAGAAPIPLSLIVLETTPALPVPAELAFTSVEGDTAGRPQLILQYCDP